jgi:CBS domain-containing protein
MSVGRICTRTVSTASGEESVAVAAARMAEHDVGTLVVLDAASRPEGILTDRDLVVRGGARGLDPAATRVTDVMSRPPLCVHESTPIEDGLARMAHEHARRLVVTGDDGRLIGILTLDDVLDLLAEEAQTIGRILRR